MSQAPGFLALITALWLYSLDTPLYAEELDYAAIAQPRATALGAATSVPISGAEIVAKLNTPTGAEIHFRVLDGGMLRVIDEETGVTHGFIVQRQEGAVVFHQYLIELHPSGGGEMVTSLDRSFRTSSSEKAMTDEGHYFELLAIDDKKAAASPESLFPRAPAEPSLCCIYCSGRIVCSCSVSAYGASCCSGSCCGGGGGRPSERHPGEL